MDVSLLSWNVGAERRLATPSSAAGRMTDGAS